MDEELDYDPVFDEGDILLDDEDINDSPYEEILYDDDDSLVEDDLNYDDEFYDEDDESAEGRRSNLRKLRRKLRHRALVKARARKNYLRTQARSKARYARRGRIRQGSPFRPQRKASTNQVRKGFVRTEKAIKNVDLDNKVMADAFGKALKAQGKRISKSEYSQAASKVVDEFKTQFPDLITNPIIKTALPLAPLLFLEPKKKGSGFESMISDPRIWGSALAAGIAIFKDIEGADPQEVVLSPNNIAIPVARQTFTLNAVVRGKSGKIISGRNVDYDSLNPNIATVSDSGVLTLLLAGSVTITATDRETGLNTAVTLTVT